MSDHPEESEPIVGSIDQRVLWWNGERSQWQDVPWGVWGSFLGVSAYVSSPGDGTLPGVPPGYHRFVVCVLDEAGVVVNVVVHRYVVEENGTLGASVDSLTAEERADYDRLMLMGSLSDRDAARLDEIRAVWAKQLMLPPDAAAELIRNLPGPISAEPGVGIHSFLEEAGVIAPPKSIQ